MAEAVLTPVESQTSSGYVEWKTLRGSYPINNGQRYNNEETEVL